MKHEEEIRKILSAITPSGSLKSQLKDKDNDTEFDKIRTAYKNRNKLEETTHA